MAGYLVFDIAVTDPAAYADYQRVAAPVLKGHGGEFMLASETVEVLEGDWHPASLSVVRFATVEAARAFYHSADYQATIPLRQKASLGKGLLIGSPS